MNMTKSQAKKVQEIIDSMEGTTHTFETIINGDDVFVIETYNSENEHYKGRKDKYTINRRGGMKIQSWV